LDISLDDVAINVSSLINNIAQQKYQASKSMFTFCKHHPPVLVVDDVSFNVMALKLLLSKRKLASDECYNGYDALQKVKARFNQQHC
jgi:PleD family two-component response regulator